MNCLISGIVGLGMLGATFATMSVSEEENNYLRSTLSPKLVSLYNQIVIERRNQYFQGILLGLIVAYCLLMVIKTSNVFHKITFVLAVTLPISVLYYFVMPKSDYMLNHLQNAEQVRAWLNVYKTMKTRYYTGFLISTLAAIPIAYAMCNTL